MAKMEAAQIEHELNQYFGTETYHFDFLSVGAGVVYTDGIKKMVELCGAYWLLQAIFSHQKKCKSDPKGMLQYMQFWTLQRHREAKNSEPMATLICERDSNDVFVKQEIDFTDFPLDEMRVWLEGPIPMLVNGQERMVMVAMLPNER